MSKVVVVLKVVDVSSYFIESSSVEGTMEKDWSSCRYYFLKKRILILSTCYAAQAKVFAALLSRLFIQDVFCIGQWSSCPVYLYCTQVEIQLRGTAREPIGNESLVDISPIYVITYFSQMSSPLWHGKWQWRHLIRGAFWKFKNP
jgi:hypothetical protein